MCCRLPARAAQIAWRATNRTWLLRSAAVCRFQSASKRLPCTERPPIRRPVPGVASWRPRPSRVGRECSALENQREHQPEHDDALRAVYGDADERTAIAL